jgi:hypothetical protein
VTYPAIGIRRKVSVFRKYFIRGEVLAQLHQETIVTNMHTQWIERFSRVNLFRQHAGLTWRRHAEIDEQVLEHPIAVSTSLLWQIVQRSLFGRIVCHLKYISGSREVRRYPVGTGKSVKQIPDKATDIYMRIAD